MYRGVSARRSGFSENTDHPPWPYSPVNRGTTVQGKLLTHNWIMESIIMDYHITLKLSLLFNKLEYNNTKGLH